ncbi:unnamed protein product [Pylaiella littoralis]
MERGTGRSAMHAHDKQQQQQQQQHPQQHHHVQNYHHRWCPPGPHQGLTTASSSTLGRTRNALSSSSSSLPSSSASSMFTTALIWCLLAALMVALAGGQQMDPAEMQRMIQQQMGGSPGGGGGGGAPPNRIAQLVCAAGAGGASVARSARRHPKAAVAVTAATATAVWAAKESRTSGVLVSRSPRVSLFRPSDAYLSRVLESAADAPVASPLHGVILSPLDDPDAEEEQEEQHEGGGSERGSEEERGSSGRRRVGGGGGSSSRSSRSSRVSLEKAAVAGGGEGEVTEIRVALARARNVAGEGSYTEQAFHEKGKGVKSVCAGVRVGRGLGLFHKFAQGLGNLDVFDGRSDCELLATESSSEDVGSTLGLLTRPALGTWSLCPLRVVLRRERTLPVPRDDDGDGSRGSRDRLGSSGSGKGSGGGSRSSSSSKRRRSRRSRKRSSRRRSGRSTAGARRGRDDKEEGEGDKEAVDESHRQYTLAMSAVEGAGWSGTWVFRVTFDAETDEVWFETKLAQRKGAFGTTPGGDMVARINRVNQDMLARANKHAAVLRTREEQFSRVSSLARTRARDAKELARDRILNPDKYKRVHRYMREDSHTTGGPTARPARWGEERRRNDIRLK